MDVKDIFAALFKEHSGDNRPSWNEYFLFIACIVALRSTCNVIATGAVIVKDNKIISTGYTGAPCGFEHCCTRGDCWIDHKEVGECQGVHAAVNAILYAAAEDLRGATIFISGYDRKQGCLIEANPCGHCLAVIKNVGIEHIVTMDQNVPTQLV